MYGNEYVDYGAARNFYHAHCRLFLLDQSG